MRRRVAYAALLLLMLGQPMNAMAGQQIWQVALHGIPPSGDRFVPDTANHSTRQNELVRCPVAKDDETRGLARF
jgi:hypothetical protein